MNTYKGTRTTPLPAPRIPVTQDTTLNSYTLLTRIHGELVEHTFVSTHTSALEATRAIRNPASDPIVLHNHGPA